MSQKILCRSEEWRPIPGYEGIYEVSSIGRIRSAEGKVTSTARSPHRVWKQRVMKTKTASRPYGKQDQRVILWKDGVPKTYLVSRLVAMAFIPLPFEKLTVNHINGDPMDNRIENLEWCTIGENVRHAFDNGLIKCQKSVTLIGDDGNEETFRSMAEAGRHLGKTEKYVSGRVCRGYNTVHGKGGETYEVVVNG